MFDLNKNSTSELFSTQEDLLKELNEIGERGKIEEDIELTKDRVKNINEMLDAQEHLLTPSIEPIVKTEYVEVVKEVPTTIIKDRIFLAVKRPNSEVQKFVLDGNCSYCRRLVDLNWLCCPYCFNGKDM